MKKLVLGLLMAAALVSGLSGCKSARGGASECTSCGK